MGDGAPFSGIRVIENHLLPTGTMVVSPDVYAMLKGENTSTKFKEQVDMFCEILKKRTGEK